MKILIYLALVALFFGIYIFRSNEVHGQYLHSENDTDYGPSEVETDLGNNTPTGHGKIPYNRFRTTTPKPKRNRRTPGICLICSTTPSTGGAKVTTTPPPPPKPQATTTIKATTKATTKATPKPVPVTTSKPFITFLCRRKGSFVDPNTPSSKFWECRFDKRIQRWLGYAFPCKSTKVLDGRTVCNVAGIEFYP